MGAGYPSKPAYSVDSDHSNQEEALSMESFHGMQHIPSPYDVVHLDTHDVIPRSVTYFVVVFLVELCQLYC